MRPAKSFWKNAQDWRATWKWFCQRIMLATLTAIAWLLTRFCAICASGRSSSSTTAMPSSIGQFSVHSVSGLLDVTSVTMRPMKAGMVESRMATMKPATNSAANSHFAWRAKCQNRTRSSGGWPAVGCDCAGGSVGSRAFRTGGTCVRTEFALNYGSELARPWRRMRRDLFGRVLLPFERVDHPVEVDQRAVGITEVKREAPSGTARQRPEYRPWEIRAVRLRRPGLAPADCHRTARRPEPNWRRR